ncbi:MAG: shikimate kinase AroK [Steroidobacteraceae bacterium]
MIGKNSIFLIGPMGSGKTAVGRQLARMLDLEFVDSDVEIEARTGVDIPLIFEKEGEVGFREREREAIDALTTREGIVLATGGGAVLKPANRENLSQRGCVVYLQTSVEQQMERTRHGRQRPLLYTSDPKTRLRELLVERLPLYESTADLIVSTDGRRVQAVAEEIAQLLAASKTASS